MSPIRCCALAVVCLTMSAFPGLAEEKELTNTVLPIAISAWIPCAAGGAGEWVTLAGNVHTVVSGQVNPNDVVILRTHVNPQQVTGVGTSTGTTYQGNGVTRFSITLDSNPEPPVDYTYVNNFRVIGAGPDNNLSVKHDIHITVNGDGTVAVSIEKIRITCQ